MKASDLPQLNDRRDRAAEAAEAVLKLVQSRLFMEFRYLGNAIALMNCSGTYEVSGMSTRGSVLCYNPLHVIALYRDEPKRLYREYLHAVLHLVFRHPFVSPKIDHRRWNLACDAAIENVIREMHSDLLEVEGTEFQYALLDRIRERSGKLTAESIYRSLNTDEVSDDELRAWSSLVYRDSHSDWYSEMHHQPDDAEETRSEGSSADDALESTADRKEIRELWESISATLDVDLETFSAGEIPPDALVQNLRSVNREHVNYRDFLRKFAVYNEEIQINDEEFDYISYTYGLSHYGNMPLIDPLEYQEAKKIQEFVIAIDTSGSVEGELVQKFVEKTCNILMERENFFRRIHLRIIQCDDRIREEAVLKSREEFEEYLRHMTLKGFSYTDFRPVFMRVEELIKEHAFERLRGLIYFTDGYGEYPAAMPPYDAAFVFCGHDDERPDPPPWAIRAVLDEEQIRA